MQLVVGLWQDVLRVDGGFRQISDSGSFNNVSDSHSLDSLVLWDRLGTVNTSDWLDVTSTLLVSTVGSSLLWHCVCVFLYLCMRFYLIKKKSLLNYEAQALYNSIIFSMKKKIE